MCFNYCLQFSKISSTKYIRNIFNSESNCFHYLFPKKYSFLKNIYVIIMSEDTPECAKLHHFRGNIYATYITP